MQKIHSNNAPAAVGPYSQAMVHNGILYTSGQVGLVPETGKPVGDDIVSQAEQVCKNLQAVAEAAGTSLDNTIKTTCFLADIADFKAFNEVYAKYFVNKPARSCFAVKDLPLGMLCEVEIICAIK